MFVLLVGTLAALVALFVEHKGRRETAYRVLRLVLGAGLGSGGVVTLALRLHEAGLLP
ncbi:hypothetical protein [Amycolatopsis sp. CA-126428]|uniref:hypothetical protein n=1 Tax=Amycolatopsis sp. CA-126428 TaxID=2073158 RepID=UPI001304A93F|nr:hypothetical protein [Amycolatopsis sp. CA-126428]